MVPDDEPIDLLLPTLDKTIEDYANSTVSTSSEELNFFTKEVEQNIMNPYGEKVGFIVLRRVNLDIKPRLGLIVMCYGPMFFGAPIMAPKIEMTYEVRILDKHRKLIGKYENSGEGKAFVAFYWGYSMKGASRKAFTDAWNDTFAEIRDEIEEDSARLIEALSK